MFRKIMCPVDLGHRDTLDRALACAADLGRHYGCPVVYVGVTAPQPGKLGHSPEEFRQRLAEFAGVEARRHGISAEAHVAIAHDPVTEVDDALIRAVAETGADLVVMATHVPRALDRVWPSNGGRLAGHAACSVLLVRG